MEKKLKEFIESNKKEFEEDFPEQAVWNNIQLQLPANKHTIYKTWLQIAAAIIVLLASGIVYMWFAMPNNNNNVLSEGTPSSQHNMMQELTEAEQFYAAEINERKQELFSLVSHMPEIKQDVQTEFTELDSVYTQLRSELKQNTSNEEIIAAMIQNYRIRLQILEDMLYYLNKANNNTIKTNTYEL